MERKISQPAPATFFSFTLLPEKLIQLAQNNMDTVLEMLNTSSKGISGMAVNLSWADQRSWEDFVWKP